MTLQFDFLPDTVNKYERAQNSKSQLECRLEAYFEDQTLRQAIKAQNVVSGMDLSKQASNVKKKKKRTKYNIIYKMKQRQDADFKAKEKVNQQT